MRFSADREAWQEAERRLCRTSLIDFIVAVAPWFVVEEVHLQLTEELEAVERGEIDRLMIFEAPRTGKSQVISRFFPAWYVGKRPQDQILQTTHTAELSVDHGRAVRDLIDDEAYQRIFPGVSLRADVRGAGHWMIEHGLSGQKQGEYYAAGVGGRIAGRGWNLGIIDDPLSEQDISELARANVRKWYGPGFYTRRQPERNAVILMTTRWAADDLPGYLLDLEKSDPNSDRWRVVEVPAILTDEAAATLNRYSSVAAFYDKIRARDGKTSILVPDNPIVYKAGDSFAPRRWPLKELVRAKSTMTTRDWSAIYLQRPVAEEGHILKRADWRKWKSSEPPECFEIIACYDTAFEEDEEADYSARTTWGLFEHADLTNVILLETWKDRLDSKPLINEMVRHAKEYDVDRVLIEKRASGSWLIKEARRHRLPARGWLPPMRGNRNKGKVPRAKMASFALESGAVWHMDRQWAEEVIDECAEVPFGKHDDVADTVTMALIDLRERWKLEIKGVDDFEPEDDEDDADTVLNKRRAYG